MSETNEQISRVLAQKLESLQAAGVAFLPKAPPAASPSTEAPPAESHFAESQIAEPTAVRPLAEMPAAAASLLRAEPLFGPSAVSQAGSLEVLQQEVCDCTRCGELASTRTQTVFGVGNPDARLCFLGEAPGADEDRLGEPFVGRAGQLLNKIIEACTLRREEVYILNILKCRPPGNRNPSPAESENCRRFLLRQLELVSPEYLCCLGAVAAQSLLETTTSIGRLRGRTHDYHGIKVVCTYHPAYLLRNPSAKKNTWDDMKMLMRLMGVEL
ncbi:MAG: uracil-DNA glycosylase [Planctomycetota bacterium]